MAVSQLRLRKRMLPTLAAIMLAAPCAASAADDSEAVSPFKLSGFASIIAGKAVGSLGPDYIGSTNIAGRECPCYIADWTNAGVYGNALTFSPESRAGIQASYRVNKNLNFVTQVVVRGTEPKPAVEWAYGAYEVNNNWEVQLGRKRIPLYYYSDFQDIGTAYPWVAPPPELYGWEATNYNGGSVRYKGKLGGATFTASVFGGKSTVRDSAYYTLFSEGETKITWRNIVGADLEGSRGPLTVRAVFLQAQVHASNPTTELNDFARLRAFGIAANLDFEDWFILSELTRLNREYASYKVAAPAFTLGAGYRWGNWTPFVNVSRYDEQSSDLEWYAPSDYKRTSLTLRYDIDPRSSVKAQVDRFLDTTRNFGDNAKVYRISYDRLF